MKKLESKHKEIINFCKANTDDSVIKKYSRYFKEGYDAYGIDSKIIRSQKTKWLESWKDEMTIKAGDGLERQRTIYWTGVENGDGSCRDWKQVWVSQLLSLVKVGALIQ